MLLYDAQLSHRACVLFDMSPQSCGSVGAVSRFTKSRAATFSDF